MWFENCLHAWVTVASHFPGDFLSWSRQWEQVTYQVTGTQVHCELFETFFGFYDSHALTRSFHGGIYICFLLCNAMIIFSVHFSPLPMHSIISCKKCVDFYLFWKMRNNNRWGGWAAPHQAPSVSSVSRRYWYYTVIQCQPQIALDLSSVIVIQCNLWPLWHQTIDTEQLFSNVLNNVSLLLIIHLITDELRYPSVLLLLLLCFWFTTAMSNFV